SYATQNPLKMADPSGLSPTRDGNQSAHDTAIALRMQALKELYPGAEISGDIGNAFGGADVICWTCKPGEVWIWEVKPLGTSQSTIDSSLEADLKDTRDDRRTEGKDVVLGGDFGPMSDP